MTRPHAGQTWPGQRAGHATSSVGHVVTAGIVARAGGGGRGFEQDEATCRAPVARVPGVPDEPIDQRDVGPVQPRLQPRQLAGLPAEPAAGGHHIARQGRLPAAQAPPRRPLEPRSTTSAREPREQRHCHPAPSVRHVVTAGIVARAGGGRSAPALLHEELKHDQAAGLAAVGGPAGGFPEPDAPVQHDVPRAPDRRLADVPAEDGRAGSVCRHVAGLGHLAAAQAPRRRPLGSSVPRPPPA